MSSMIEIDEVQALKDLENLKAEDTVIELVLNNVRMYNGLIKEIQDGKRTIMYLAYQLNVQISKQFLDLKKLNRSTSETKGKNSNAFLETLESIKKSTQKKPTRKKNGR